MREPRAVGREGAAHPRFDVEEDELGVDDAHELAVLSADHGRDPAPVTARREGGPSTLAAEEGRGLPALEIPPLDSPVAAVRREPSAANVASSMFPA